MKRKALITTILTSAILLLAACSSTPSTIKQVTSEFTQAEQTDIENYVAQNFDTVPEKAAACFLNKIKETWGAQTILYLAEGTAPEIETNPQFLELQKECNIPSQEEMQAAKLDPSNFPAGTLCAETPQMVTMQPEWVREPVNPKEITDDVKPIILEGTGDSCIIQGPFGDNIASIAIFEFTGSEKDGKTRITQIRDQLESQEEGILITEPPNIDNGFEATILQGTDTIKMLYYYQNGNLFEIISGPDLITAEIFLVGAQNFLNGTQDN